MSPSHSIDALSSLIGEHRDSDLVQARVKSDNLTLAVEPDLEEGEPERSSLESKTLGYAIGCTGGIAASIFFYIEPREGFTCYAGELVHGLAATATPSDVRSALGTPERSGQPQPAGLLGPSGAWDRFIQNDLRIHFQYTLDGTGISLITVMCADIAP